MHGAAAQRIEVTAAELVADGDHRGAQGPVFMCPLNPGQTIFTIYPNGKSHALSSILAISPNRRKMHSRGHYLDNPYEESSVQISLNSRRGCGYGRSDSRPGVCPSRKGL